MSDRARQRLFGDHLRGLQGAVLPAIAARPQSRGGVPFILQDLFDAGWRIAFAVGNAEVLANLAKFKSFLDYGIPGFIQEAAVEALNGPQDYVTRICSIYKDRRDALVRALGEAGWPVASPKGTMYLWSRVPEPFRAAGSFAFAEQLLLKEGVVVSPGIGFGPYGEGFVRFALVDEIPRIEEAARRIGRFLRSAPAPKKAGAKTGPTVLLTEH